MDHAIWGILETRPLELTYPNRAGVFFSEIDTAADGPDKSHAPNTQQSKGFAWSPHSYIHTLTYIYILYIYIIRLLHEQLRLCKALGPVPFGAVEVSAVTCSWAACFRAAQSRTSTLIFDEKPHGSSHEYLFDDL